jgi:hypothetical protein
MPKTDSALLLIVKRSINAVCPGQPATNGHYTTTCRSIFCGMVQWLVSVICVGSTPHSLESNTSKTVRSAAFAGLPLPRVPPEDTNTTASASLLSLAAQPPAQGQSVAAVCNGSASHHLPATVQQRILDRTSRAVCVCVVGCSYCHITEHSNAGGGDECYCFPLVAR